MLFADTIGQFVKYTSSQLNGTVVDTFVCSLMTLAPQVARSRATLEPPLCVRLDT